MQSKYDTYRKLFCDNEGSKWYWEIKRFWSYIKQQNLSPKEVAGLSLDVAIELQKHGDKFDKVFIEGLNVTIDKEDPRQLTYTYPGPPPPGLKFQKSDKYLLRKFPTLLSRDLDKWREEEIDRVKDLEQSLDGVKLTVGFKKRKLTTYDFGMTPDEFKSVKDKIKKLNTVFLDYKGPTDRFLDTILLEDSPTIKLQLEDPTDRWDYVKGLKAILPMVKNSTLANGIVNMIDIGRAKATVLSRLNKK